MTSSTPQRNQCQRGMHTRVYHSATQPCSGISRGVHWWKNRDLSNVLNEKKSPEHHTCIRSTLNPQILPLSKSTMSLSQEIRKSLQHTIFPKSTAFYLSCTACQKKSQPEDKNVQLKTHKPHPCYL